MYILLLFYNTNDGGDNMLSVWQDSYNPETFPTLKKDIHTDVALPEFCAHISYNNPALIMHL